MKDGPAMRVIAIDGPAGSGKSTVGRALAGRLGLSYLASGAPRSTVWTATLPDDSATTAPASTPTPAPSASSGCGN